MIVTVPTQELFDRLTAEVASLEGAPAVDLRLWPMEGPPGFDETIDLAVLPYMTNPDRLRVLEGVDVKAAQALSLGYDNFDKYLPEGITVHNAIGVHEGPTAEIAMALLLSAMRGLPTFFESQHRGEWAKAWTPGLLGRTVLVLGVGGVGRAVIDRLRPFDVELVRVASKPRRDDEGEVFGPDDLPRLLPQADAVVVAAPLTDQTSGLFDAELIATMKPGAVLVNVGRGPIVDTDALVAACAEGRIQAALDVMDPEPVPEGHPLWSTQGISFTPHVGGWSTSMQDRVAALLVGQVTRLLAGEAPDHRVL